MIKCRAFYLPREFSAIVVTAAYIPLDANVKAAMEELHAAISKQQAAHPGGAIIVAVDFNHSNLRSVLPKFHQHVSCTTRGDNTLDHVYTNIAEAYRAISLPHLGQSDHLSLFMLPKYTPLIKRVNPSVKMVKATSGTQTDIIYTSSVLDHFNMCIDNLTTVKHVKHFPNQKPWMNSEVRLLLKARGAAFKSGDVQDYIRARAILKRCSKPVLKLVKTWPEGAISALQDYFECTDWDMFREAATNGDTTDLEEYMSSVTSYISKCINDVTVSKSITTHSNQKPWMTAKVYVLLKSRDSAFRTGDKDALRTARAKLS
ncbi:hypothetical protein QTP70_000580 [Hemibagrus guttatus]|uniref:Uncharacterized protein n=1 Tax=Hemibagrus guttatus TaxID=175788 RepID=A0AAE0QPH7_9TELE|nr:hypothetical protein QTP70_000580 [Hemibagrus guttatus]